MIVRQLTLADSMVQAWKDVGGWFPKRERSVHSKLDLMVRSYDANSPIINLGDMGFNPSDLDLEVRGINPDKYYNRPEVVRPLVRPGTARRLLDEFMPSDPRASGMMGISHAWIKAPGQAGQGKTKIPVYSPNDLPEIPADWDMQVHVEGQEYRVVTVGTKVVQVNERYGENGSREYTWVGVRNSPGPVKTIAREAARRLEDERTIIGWDVIHGDRTYIFEGNTCPGTNNALAERIINQVNGVAYANSHSN